MLNNFILKVDKYGVGTLSFFLSLLRTRNHQLPHLLPPTKILVILLARIGDAVLTIPAIRALRAMPLPLRIVALTTHRTDYIYRECPYFNEVCQLDLRQEETSGRMFIQGSKNLAKAIYQLRSYRFDVIIDFENSLRSTPLLAYLIGASQIIGFDTRGERRGYLLSTKVPYSLERSEIECFLDIVQYLGASPQDKQLELPDFKEEGEFVEELLVKEGIKIKDRLVIIHPCASWPIKEWPLDRFAQVAKNLVDLYNARVILLGGIKDKAKVAGLCQRISRPAVINMAGEITLKQLTMLLKKNHLFIGNDSGIAHIAVAVNTPTITLFGPSNPIKWGHYGKQNLVITANAPCAPCQPGGWEKINCPDRQCLYQITVAHVMDAIKEQWS